MLQKPRPFTSTFFNFKEIVTSIVQGIVIAAGVLTVYQYAVYRGLNENTTRTMVFATLITANIFLTLMNRSFYFSTLTTLRYKNNLVVGIIALTLIISSLLIYNDFFARFFKFQALTVGQIGVSLGVGFLSVIWYEVVKWRKRK